MIANPSYKATGCGCGGSGTLSAAPCGCGGSECAACQGQGIARPRFFAGQLLTEDDLQLLTDYVGYKDRLHNRHLFGAGVVCGLEITCHPCGDGRVIVHPGYALDCCGNDLVLACAQSLDINAMVSALRRDQMGGFDCGDPCPDPEDIAAQPKKESKDEKDSTTLPPKPEFRYCLYARYCEAKSDPVMPYSTGDDCGSIACQATRVREGVRFELRCRPKGDAANPMLERLCACLGDLQRLQRVWGSFQQLQSNSRAARERLKGGPGPITQVVAGGAVPGTATGGPPPTDVNITHTKESAASFSEVRDWLIERLSNSPFLTDCTLRDKVYGMALPTLLAQPGTAEISSYVAATEPLIEAFVNYLRDCICRAFNPSCTPCDDTAVLLACLEVDDCKVVRVCNLERTFVLSPAAVRYWLPPLQLIGSLVERLCCDPLEKLFTDRTDNTLDLGVGNVDMAQLLKEEVTRILEDSLCLVNKAHLKQGIDKIFAPRQPNTNQGAVPPPATGGTDKGVVTPPADTGATKPADTKVDKKTEVAPEKVKVSFVAPKRTRTRARKKADVKTGLGAAESKPAEPPPSGDAKSVVNGAKSNDPKGDPK